MAIGYGIWQRRRTLRRPARGWPKWPVSSLGYPGLTLEVEGHTDSVGSEEYNQRLSEQRAGSVRYYLIKEGITAMNSVPAKGFGKLQPVATNETAAGRQLNRRVELIVSGEIIGTQIASSDLSQ